MAFVLMRLSSGDPTLRLGVLAALLVIVGVLVRAARRADTRRPLPIWGHIANIVEVITGAAVMPLLLQVLGGYAYIRSLVG